MLNQARLFYCPADMIFEERYRPCGKRLLERDDFSSNHHPALSCWFVARPDGKPVSTFTGRALAAPLPVCVAAASTHAQQHAEAVFLAFVEALVERLGGVGELLQVGCARRHRVGAFTPARD